jgi:hypothetical protein
MECALLWSRFHRPAECRGPSRSAPRILANRRGRRECDSDFACSELEKTMARSPCKAFCRRRASSGSRADASRSSLKMRWPCGVRRLRQTLFSTRAGETAVLRAERSPNPRSQTPCRDKPRTGAVSAQMGRSSFSLSFSLRNRFRFTLQMVAAAASNRRRISIFSRTLSTHCAGTLRVFRWPSTSSEI